MQYMQILMVFTQNIKKNKRNQFSYLTILMADVAIFALQYLIVE